MLNETLMIVFAGSFIVSFLFELYYVSKREEEETIELDLFD